jgi:hypothetical protein
MDSLCARRPKSSDTSGALCSCVGLGAQLRGTHRHAGGGVGVRRVERLGLEQRMAEGVELVAMLAEHLGDLRMGVVDQTAHLLVDQALGVPGRLADAGKERSGAVAREYGDRSDRIAHPPAADHLARDLGQLLDV